VLITYRDIEEVSFPVFNLPNGNWQLLDGLLFLDDLILDDKNMQGDTLGKRRLQTPHETLFSLKKSLDSHVGIIKSRDKHFIDSKGMPFIYEKSKMCPIKYHSIRKVERKEVASLLHLNGVKKKFIVPRPPPSDCSWAGVIYIYNMPWMLYDYSPERQKDTRRKI
jgi:hypothetical protein